MTIGMLWLCNSKESLEKNIELAAAAHQRKYGKPAQICLVHQDLLKNVILPNNDITVRPYNLPAGHLWIGREDEPILEQAIGAAQ